MNTKRTTIIIFCLLLPLFITLFSYKSTLFFIDGTPEQQNTFDYLNNKASLTQEYTESEISHLEDVQVVMKYSDIVFYLLLLVLTFIITFYRKDTKQVQKLVKYGGITTLSVVGTVSLLSIFSFNKAFTFFHAILFPQGNWQFPIESVLIHTFPYTFFVSFAIKMGIQAFCWGIVFILVFIYVQYGLTSTKH